jgi:hypothetical protein
LPNGSPCQPSPTWRAGGAEAEQEAAADIRSSVAAVIAVIAGVRAGICMIPAPSLIVDVVPPSHESTLTTSVPHDSAAQAES